MQHWQVFEDCRAAVYYGGAWFSGSEVKLVDCHFLRCHAEAKDCGGFCSANGAVVEMIRGSIMGCSAGGSGGVYMYGMSTLSLLNVTIAEYGGRLSATAASVGDDLVDGLSALRSAALGSR